MSGKSQLPCEVTYRTPDHAPYVEVNIEFYQNCKPESALIKLLKGLSEVKKVTVSEGISVYAPPAIHAKKLKIELKPGSQTSAVCEQVMGRASTWIYNKGCAHGNA